MELTPREKDKLLIFTAALLAERHMANGRTVAELMSHGATLLTRDDIMDGVPEMGAEVQVEATFPDGTKLVMAPWRSTRAARSARSRLIERSPEEPYRPRSNLSLTRMRRFPAA
jgi:urease subunit gamma